MINIMNWFFINIQTHKKNAYQLDVIAIVSLCILTFTHGPDKISYIVWGLTFLLFFILNHGNFVNFYKGNAASLSNYAPFTERQSTDKSKMHLKKPLWSTALKETREPSSEAEPQPQQPSSATATAVDELVNSLNKQRLYREVTLALRTSLRDARAEFSFLRLRGLRSLLNFLRSVAQSDSTINLFCQTQSLPDLQGN